MHRFSRRLRYSYLHNILPRTYWTGNYTTDSLNWVGNQATHNKLCSFNIATFNLLAPCYKRLDIRDEKTGRRKREEDYFKRWNDRATITIRFFESFLLPTSQIIALQEFWLHEPYASRFEESFNTAGFNLYTLQRSGEKRDAVGLVIKRNEFEVLGRSDMNLCEQSDRVALLLYLIHRKTGQAIVLATTHLSFPHNVFDQLIQVKQMKSLTANIENFAELQGLDDYITIILGDFNVEAGSAVCDHLRRNGYFSVFQESPPPECEISVTPSALETNCSDELISAVWSTAVPIEELELRYPLFVSHRNHRNEELGVDHIFIKPSNDLAPHLTPQVDNGRDISLFVDGSQVVPLNLTAKTWDHTFQVSDHRPIMGTVVFASKKESQSK